MSTFTWPLFNQVPGSLFNFSGKAIHDLADAPAQPIEIPEGEKESSSSSASSLLEDFLHEHHFVSLNPFSSTTFRDHFTRLLEGYHRYLLLPPRQ